MHVTTPTFHERHVSGNNPNPSNMSALYEVPVRGIPDGVLHDAMLPDNGTKSEETVES